MPNVKGEESAPHDPKDRQSCELLKTSAAIFATDRSVYRQESGTDE